MRRLFIICASLVSGCVVASPEQRAVDVVTRYGSQCGVSVATMGSLTEAEARLVAQCLLRAEARDTGQAPVQAQAALSPAQSRCQAFGFTSGTDAFADCVRREYQCEQARRQYQVTLGAAMMQEGSKPGASFGGAAGRATTRTAPPQCY